MALIECPECGHRLSTHAAKCPECGYPMRRFYWLNRLARATASVFLVVGSTTFVIAGTAAQDEVAIGGFMAASWGIIIYLGIRHIEKGGRL